MVGLGESLEAEEMLAGLEDLEMVALEEAGQVYSVVLVALVVEKEYTQDGEQCRGH